MKKQYITPAMKVAILDMEDCCCQLTVGSPTTTDSTMLVKGKRNFQSDAWDDWDE